MSDAPRPSASHVPALDGVRGIAIALVLLHHSGWPRFVGPIGWVGVDLFFVLSGYLITSILIDTREASHRARSFYVRRALRIFPLYYAVLVAVFVVAPTILSIHWPSYRALVPEQIWYWTYLCDWPMAFSHPPIVTILGHFWTLSIEEQFYWVWPLVIWALSRQAAVRLCGVLVVGASILRIFLVTHVPLVLNPSLVVAFEYLFLPTRIDGLAVGALVALVLRGPGGAAALVRWLRPAAVAGGGALAVVVIWRGTASHDDPWMIMIGYPAIALAFGGVVLYAVVRRSTVLELAPLRTLGKYSYGLYVLHQPIMMVARGTFRLPDANVGAGRSFTVTMLPIVFVAAYLSYHLFEKHFLRLKNVLGPIEPQTGEPVRAALAPG
jgi:peptidoglycan/LPS O-acetylase OafA/YrhL